MDFRKNILKPLRLKTFFLKRMPMGFFAGLRVDKFDTNEAVVSLPFNGITKNPFRSVYFGAQAMAAELSTGVLAMDAVIDSKKNVSMLVFDMKAHFSKKAVSRISFRCDQGGEIRDAIQQAIETKEGVTVEVKSIGIDQEGDIVSEFNYTWTFKLKSK
jgi:acyl-coenzyme A thioesterase PaaI-like protein